MPDIKYFDIAIIGGGAAGLAAAYGASSFNKNAKITILEKMPRPGRKIMITGKGRCNLTNMKDWSDFAGHIHPKANFLKPAFYSFDPAHTVEFFNTAGMDTVTERGDRVFPASHIASDVVDALVRSADESGVRIETGKEVERIVRKSTDNKTAFEITCSNGDTLLCEKIIIATGGLSYPSTGSTGDGYRWAEETGHKISRLFPSLTAIVPENYKVTDLRGHINRNIPLSETGKYLNGNQLKNVSITLWVNGNISQEEFGDIDFTDGGIEGPVGFKISRKCVESIMNGSKAYVTLDLKPAVSHEALQSRISKLWKEICEDRRSFNKSYRDKFNVLAGKLIPRSLVQGFIKCNQSADHKTIAKYLKNWKFNIAGYVGYERCVVTAGGVSQEDITAKTLESKKCKGMYFAGEVIDIDGDTGGYNLQTAFSTGYLAGVSAAKSLDNFQK